MLLQMGPLLRLGPNVMTDGTFITLGSKSYYGWDLYYTWVHLLHLCLQQFNILLAYLLAFSYGKSPQTSKLDGEDT